LLIREDSDSYKGRCAIANEEEEEKKKKKKTRKKKKKARNGIYRFWNSGFP